MPGSDYSIAAGFASGAAVSVTPFIGLHFLMGFALAWLVRANLLASAIGTIVGNPWTFPLIFALTARLGRWILGHDVIHVLPSWSWSGFLHAPSEYIMAFVPIIWPMLVGSIPLAIVIWIGFYIALRIMVSANRARKQARIRARQRQQLLKNEDILE